MTTNMKKSLLFCLSALLILVFGISSCSSSDDDEIFGTGLTGKWDLVEVQNGPEGGCNGDYANKYPSGTLIIEIKGNGKIVFNYEDGKVETLDYSIPEDQDKYYSSLPIMIIGEDPYGYVVEGNILKLHYAGIYTCDHIPATYVFKRTK